MRLPGENEYRNSRLSMKYMVMGVALCLMLIVGVVVLANREDKAKKRREQQQETTVLALEHEGDAQSEAPGDADGQGGVPARPDSAGAAGSGGTVRVDESYASENTGPSGNLLDSYASEGVSPSGNLDGSLDGSYALDGSGTADSKKGNAVPNVGKTAGGADESYASESTGTAGNSYDSYASEGSGTAGNPYDSYASESAKTAGNSYDSHASESSGTAGSPYDSKTPQSGITANAGSPSTGAVMNFNGGKSLEEVERLYAEQKLVASDLDFWDMYPKAQPPYMSSTAASAAGGSTQDSSQKKKEDSSGTASKARYEEEAERELQKEAEKEERDPSKDGKHTLVIRADGEEEWVLINPYLEQNTYDFSRLTVKQNKLTSYADGKSYSYAGVDLSKYNGEVDFVTLKQAGVSYVMLRLGMRGYGSGQIMPDEKFTDYMAKATEAGLDIGVYFYSQAVTEAEAVEEANFVIQNLANYKITYPVAFDMEYVANDTARVEALTREEKTKMAKSFLDTVKQAGYKPMVYGNKEWLIKQVDLTKLTDYDIWLSQPQAVPDYPYRFQMWQYSREGKLKGVDGNVNLNICFVDYSEK